MSEIKPVPCRDCGGEPRHMMTIYQCGTCEGCAMVCEGCGKEVYTMSWELDDTAIIDWNAANAVEVSE